MVCTASHAPSKDSNTTTSAPGTQRASRTSSLSITLCAIAGQRTENSISSQACKGAGRPNR